MKILKQISHDRGGNDCWIYDTFVIVSNNETHFFIHHLKVTGYRGTDEMNCRKISGDVELRKILTGTNYELNEEEINEICNFNW